MSTSSSPRPLAAVPDGETPATTGGSRTGVRRRTLVTGAAWAVPAVVIASPAAFAVASPDDTPRNDLCSIMYHEGDMKRQSVEFGLSVAQDKGVIAAGTTFYWTIGVSEATNVGDPVVASETPDTWKVEISAQSKTYDSAVWLVKATTTIELTAPLDICAIFLDWRGTVPRQPGYISGGSKVQVYSYGTDPDGLATSHQFMLAKRRTDLAEDGYTEEELKMVHAHVYRSSSTQSSPQVYWSTDGVTATGPGGTYQVSDFVNAKFRWGESGQFDKLPAGVDEHNVAYSIP